MVGGFLYALRVRPPRYFFFFIEYVYPHREIWHSRPKYQKVLSTMLKLNILSSMD